MVSDMSTVCVNGHQHLIRKLHGNLRGLGDGRDSGVSIVHRKYGALDAHPSVGAQAGEHEKRETVAARGSIVCPVFSALGRIRA